MERGDIYISGFDPDRLGANSYDVRLGRWFYECVWIDGEAWYLGPYEAQPGEQISVPVGGTLLAMTASVIGTRGKVIAKMYARSTKVREATTVCKCAGLGDIGYRNPWVMELTGLSRIGSPLVTVGDRIAQISFFEAERSPVKAYDGQYKIEDWPLCMVPSEWRGNILNVGGTPGDWQKLDEGDIRRLIEVTTNPL